MKVFWTDTAIQHLSGIYTYVAQNSPQYAQRLIDRLTTRSKQIASFPLSGRAVPEFETKQIREVIESSYRIIYYIKSEQIDILAVLHGSHAADQASQRPIRLTSGMQSISDSGALEKPSFHQSCCVQLLLVKTPQLLEHGHWVGAAF